MPRKKLLPDELDDGLNSDDTNDSGSNDSGSNDEKKGKRRLRSPHPGVKLKPPSGQVAYWRARYRDPDSGRSVDRRLPHTVTTKSHRRAWAINKSRELSKRKAELETGAVRKTGGSLADAVALFFKNRSTVNRARTLKRYRIGANHMLAWADANGTTLDALGPSELMRLGEYIHEQPKRYSGKKGGKQATGKLRSHTSVNSDIRGVKTILRYLRKARLLPKLSTDDIKDGFEKFKERKDKPEFLAAHDVRAVLEACMRHDAECFKMTREERPVIGERKNSRPGRTPRYTPIAPFALACVLSGMRLEENLLIEWSTHVRLDAVDYQNNSVGLIHLRAQDTKTEQERDVVFDVSPMLRELFSAMRRATGGTGRVFNLTSSEATAAMKRLRKFFGAPANFTWQKLRATCATYLSSAPGIYGSASSFHAAKQLGHSVQVQEKYYAGRVFGIPPTIRTLEAALQIEEVGAKVISQVLSDLADGNVIKLKR